MAQELASERRIQVLKFYKYRRSCLLLVLFSIHTTHILTQVVVIIFFFAFAFNRPLHYKQLSSIRPFIYICNRPVDRPLGETPTCNLSERIPPSKSPPSQNASWDQLSLGLGLSTPLNSSPVRYQVQLLLSFIITRRIWSDRSWISI